VPTQDGGQFVEHQGQIYKNIQITGTTGMRPNRKVWFFIPILGITNPFTRQHRPCDGLAASESGLGLTIS
jgi:hypothetical protein